MINFQRLVMLFGICSLGLAALAGLGVLCHACYIPRLYWSSCRFDHSPANAEFYAQANFRARILGGDKSLRIEMIRGTTMADVIAAAATPAEAAEKANAAMAKIRMALSRTQPTSVRIVEAADPSLVARCPFLDGRHLLWLAIAAMFGFWGTILTTAGILRHRWSAQ